MSNKRYDVLSPRAKKDGGTYWHRVGTAFEGDKGISIEFNSLPLPDKEGKVRVSLFEPKEKGDAPDRVPASAGRGSTRRPVMAGGDDMDDEIPF